MRNTEFGEHTRVLLDDLLEDLVMEAFENFFPWWRRQRHFSAVRADGG